MRQSYQTQLADLSEIGARVCDLAVEAMQGASTALLDADLGLAERVIAMDITLDDLRTEAEEGAVQLLALQAPVASDLRTVVSALWIVADGQRMGALAIHVAKAARRRHPGSVLPDSVRPIFAEMGRVAVELGTEAAAVQRDRDPQRARAIDAKDAEMDALHRQLLTALLSPEWDPGSSRPSTSRCWDASTSGMRITQCRSAARSSSCSPARTSAATQLSRWPRRSAERPAQICGPGEQSLVRTGTVAVPVNPVHPG